MYINSSFKMIYDAIIYQMCYGIELKHKTVHSDVPQCSSFFDGRRPAVIKLRNLTSGGRRTVGSGQPRGSGAAPVLDELVE